jgi:hypothetical protein
MEATDPTQDRAPEQEPANVLVLENMTALFTSVVAAKNRNVVENLITLLRTSVEGYRYPIEPMADDPAYADSGLQDLSNALGTAAYLSGQAGTHKSVIGTSCSGATIQPFGGDFVMNHNEILILLA